MIFYKYSLETGSFCIETPETNLTYIQILKHLAGDGVSLDSLSSIQVRSEIANTYSPLDIGSLHSADPRLDLLLCSRSFTALSEKVSRLEESRNCYKDLLEYFGPTQSVDITVMYADLLVKQVNHRLEECRKNLDYASERSKLEEALRRSNLHIRVEFTGGSLKIIGRALENKSKILHISCHGKYRNNQFVLVLENSAVWGLKEEVTSEQLSAEIKMHEQYFNVVVVSACYSNAVAHILAEAGFDCVIAIHDKWEILDETAILFSEVLYENLFKGNTILSSFAEAKDAVKRTRPEGIVICCCRHQHKSWCKWNPKNCAQQHTPPCQCSIDNNPNLHKASCQWARDFVKRYNRNRVIEGEVFTMCCCSPELTHDDSEKFKLLCKDEDVKMQRLFSSANERHNLHDDQPFVFSKNPVKLLKRNAELHKLLEMMKTSRLINVFGALGVGKTLLVQSAAHYAYERKAFKNGIVYIDLQKKEFIEEFFAALNTAINFDGDFTGLCSHLARTEALIIIDNAGEILRHYKDIFVRKVQTLLESCPYCKLWVVTQQACELEAAKQYELKPLTKEKTMIIFKDKLKPELYKKHSRHIASLIKTNKLRIKEVWPVLHRIMQDQPFEDLISADVPATVDPDAEMQIYRTILSLKYKSQKQLQFLHLLALLPKGIALDHLRLLCSQTIFSCERNLRKLKTDINYRKTFFEDETEDVEFIKLIETVAEYTIHNHHYAINSLIVLQFLCALARTIMIKISRSNAYVYCRALKSIAHFNPLIPSSIWDTQYKKQTDMLMEAYRRKTLREVLANFESMKHNFMNFIHIEFLEVAFRKKINNEVLSAVFELSESLICIYAIKENSEKAFEVLDWAKITLKRFNMSDQPELIPSMSTGSCFPMISEPYYKIRLTAAALTFEYTNKYRIALQKAKNISDVFVMKKMDDCEAESYLLVALILIKRLKNEEKINLEGEIETYLEKAKKKYKELKNNTGVARTLLATASYYLDHRTDLLNIRAAEELSKMLEFFKKDRLYGLEMKCLMTLGDIYALQKLKGTLVAFDDKQKWQESYAEMYWSDAIYNAKVYGAEKLELKINRRLKLIGRFFN